MGIKNFFIRKTLEHKLKDVPAAQREIMMQAMEKNPEFFKKISEEIKRRTKRGESELAATMAVMRENQGEFQRILKQ